MRLPPLRFPPLRRFPENGQPLTSQKEPLSGLRCLLSVSHALKAFLHPHSADLVSCRSRPWGFSLQGPSSLTEQPPLSRSSSLLRFSDSFACHANRPVFGSSLGHSAFSPDQSFRHGIDGNLPRFRALFPASGCSSPSAYSPEHEASTLLGFYLPRVCLPLQQRLPRNLTSHGLSRRLRLRRMPSRDSLQRDRLNSLESANPFEVCHLLGYPASSRARFLWVTPLGPSRVTTCCVPSSIDLTRCLSSAGLPLR